jgi:hypothetical protein
MPRAADPLREEIVFELERLELTAADRLELSGRWYGVRGRRFVRPTLTLRADGAQHRALADLQHKPWGAEDGESWLAAFPLDLHGDGAQLGDLELAVAPDIAIPLPAPGGKPSEGGDRESPRIATRGASVASNGGVRAGTEELRLALEAERDQTRRLRVELERAEAAKVQEAAALARRDAALSKLEDVTAERDAASEGREEALREREEAIAERDAALQGREDAIAERDTALRGREDAIAERDTALQGREDAIAERDQALLERELAIAERDQAVPARDRALAERDAAARSLDDAVHERNALSRACERLQRGRDAALAARDLAMERSQAIQATAESRLGELRAELVQLRAQARLATHAQPATQPQPETHAQPAEPAQPANPPPVAPFLEQSTRARRRLARRDLVARRAVDWPRRAFAIVVLAAAIVALAVIVHSA